MLAQVERWKLDDTAKQTELVARQKVELTRVTDRLNRLLEVFIDGTIAKDEFTAHKEKLVQDKAALSDSIACFEAKGANRFKPLEDFISASKQAKYDAQAEDSEELRTWHKKAGSNLLFSARVLSEEFEERSDGAAQAASRGAASLPASDRRFLSPEGPRGGSAARSAPKLVENHQQSAFAQGASADKNRGVSPVPSRFVPILPPAVSALAESGLPTPEGVVGIASLFRRSSPILHVRYPGAWGIVVKNRGKANWRRG
ncbi:MAG: hypothetical protein V1929_00375 [bacterium]